MDSFNLQIFVEAARLSGFAPVARNLNLDPSAISRAIGALEDELGARLFHRSTRKIALTEAGQLFLSRIAPLIDELAHARNEVLEQSKGISGTLRLTSSVAFGYQILSPLLPELKRRYPALKLDIVMTDANLHLINDRIDLAIRLGSRFEGDVVCTKIKRTQYILCASPSYIASHGKPKTPKDVSKHRCLLLTLPEFQNNWLFKNTKGDIQTIPVEGDIMISNPLAQLRCASGGLGPALLADWLVQSEIKNGTLVDLFPRYQITATTFDTGLWLLYPSRTYLPLKVRTMIDYLKEKLGS